MRTLLITLAFVLVGFPRPAETPALTAVYKVVPPAPVKVMQRVEVTEWQWVSMGTFVITAYCANCDVCDTTWRTADQTYADHRKNIVAADKALSFGTALQIDGFEDWFTVHDRGQAIKGRKIDVLMSSHWRARRFGRQVRQVKVWCPVTVVKEVERGDVADRE